MKNQYDNHLYIVDGSGFIFRAFHALPPLTRADGVPVNAVYGFINMMLKLLDTAEADHIVVVFDAGRKTFRNEIYPEYKAHRPPPPEELIPQFAIIRDACVALNVAAVDKVGFEADDIIATYAKKAVGQGMEVTVVSSDKDLMQLVSDNIVMFDPLKNREIGAEQVQEKFGVGPDKVVEILALAGDAVDNVPGIPGIGPKTAAELINQYGDLETLLAHANEIKQPKRRERLIEHADDARISKKLVILKDDVPLDNTIDEFTRRAPEEASLVEFLRLNSFNTLIARLEKRKAAAVPKVEPKYFLVQTVDDLQRWVAKAQESGWVAIATQVDDSTPTQAKIVGFSMATSSEEACYIPLGHSSDSDLFDNDGGLKQIPLPKAMELLSSLWADPSVMKVGHNIKFDQVVWKRYGVEITPIDDVMVISYVLDGATHAHDLATLAKLHFDQTIAEYKSIVGTGKAAKAFASVDLEQACQYAAEHTNITLRLHYLLKPKLAKESLLTVYETMERPLVPVLADMENLGIIVDVAELKKLSHNFAKRLTELEAKIYELAGCEFNIGSPKQLSEILFDKMGMPGGKKGKEGTYSTGAEVLENLVVQGHKLPAKIMEWRQLAKLKSTYTDSLVKQINPKTGRVHTSYGMTGTMTGRLSSSNPNLQNIPVRTEEGRKIRHAFVAKPGCQLISLDYSQIELRILAHMADIGGLKEAFHHGEDIHARAASEVFHVPIEKVGSDLRSRAKVINFGIIYGISASGLATSLHIPKQEAAGHIKAYLERYPGIHDYMEKMKAVARKQGHVETMFGRRCPIAGIFDKIPSRRNFAERQAINAPLQGTSADIIKRAMVKIPEALNARNLKARMLLQVHDELIFEAPDNEVDEVIKIAKKFMETAAHLSVPLLVDVGVGKNWAEA